MNTLLNNFDFVQTVLVLHQQLKNYDFHGTVQINENYLVIRDNGEETSYDLNDGNQLNTTPILDILDEPEPIVKEFTASPSESSTSNRVERIVEIINTEVSRTAILATVTYQFPPEQNWKARIETVFNDLWEHRDNQSDEAQFIRYYYFGQLLNETPRQYSRKTQEIQRELNRSKGITSVRRYYLLARRIYRLLQKCGLRKAYNFQRITYHDLVHLREDEIKEILRRI
jgi:hypothetical protein